MSQPPILPRWQGQAWPVRRTPVTSTRVAQHVSGREVRAALYARPLYQFEISFDGLSSNTAVPGLAERSLQELQSFYLACGGSLSPFLYVDPIDNTATGVPLGVGDGTTTTFLFQRQLGSRFTEVVGWVTNVGKIYRNGAVISNWSLSQPASLVFTTPPAIGAVIAADFSYAFLCRFSEDSVDLSHDMDGRWSVSSLKFQTCR